MGKIKIIKQDDLKNENLNILLKGSFNHDDHRLLKIQKVVRVDSKNKNGLISKSKPKRLNPVECQICGKFFNMKWELKRHNNLVHNDNPAFFCTICDKSFKLKYHLKAHERGHNDIKPFGCNYCDQRYTSSASLNHHQKIHDRIWKTFFCGSSGCFARFIKADDLNTHIENKHGNRKPYFYCDYCVKGYKSRRALKLHVKIKHDGT